MSASETKLPNLVALVFIILGLVIGSFGSILGAVIAGLGVVPACWGIWTGMQQQTQGGLVWSIVLAMASLGVAALLIVLRVVDWIN